MGQGLSRQSKDRDESRSCEEHFKYAGWSGVCVRTNENEC
jgi:hypothetical protein